MNKASDVIVIGAGVVGCAAAYYLAKRGVKVTVLERRKLPAVHPGAMAGSQTVWT